MIEFENYCISSRDEIEIGNVVLVRKIGDVVLVIKIEVHLTLHNLRIYEQSLFLLNSRT